MGWYVHHVNIPAYDVRESVRFYHQAAGMEECPWGYPDPEKQDDAPLDNRASMGNFNRGVHIVTERPMFAHDNGFMHNPTIGGHFAITVDDLGAVKKRLAAAGIPFDDAGVYAMAEMHQVYCYDPSFNLVEINQNVGGIGHVLTTVASSVPDTATVTITAYITGTGSVTSDSISMQLVVSTATPTAPTVDAAWDIDAEQF